MEEAFYAYGNRRETTTFPTVSAPPSCLYSRFLSWDFELDATGVVKINLRLLPAVTFDSLSVTRQFVFELFLKLQCLCRSPGQSFRM